MSGMMPIELSRSAPGFDRSGAPPIEGGSSDATLLDRFIAARDEAAFEALVRRHGPKVLRLCRRRLGDGQDADDAFQATFLVLVDRADRIHFTGDIGGWLCGVARRVADRARMRADRRRVREGAAVDVDHVAGPDEPGLDDLGPILRAEVGRLPEKYRRAIELCYWEGMSSEQAAERLRCPAGTLKWRLSRAREILRGRLVRVGIALAALLMWRVAGAEAASGAGRVDPGPGGPGPGEAVLPAELVRRTVALAVYSRDASLRRGERAVPSPPPGIRRPGRALHLVARVALLLSLLLAIPAASITVPVARWLRSVTQPTMAGDAAMPRGDSTGPAGAAGPIKPSAPRCSRD